MCVSLTLYDPPDGTGLSMGAQHVVDGVNGRNGRFDGARSTRRESLNEECWGIRGLEMRSGDFDDDENSRVLQILGLVIKSLVKAMQAVVLVVYV